MGSIIAHQFDARRSFEATGNTSANSAREFGASCTSPRTPAERRAPKRGPPASDSGRKALRWHHANMRALQPPNRWGNSRVVASSSSPGMTGANPGWVRWPSRGPEHQSGLCRCPHIRWGRGPEGIPAPDMFVKLLVQAEASPSAAHPPSRGPRGPARGCRRRPPADGRRRSVGRSSRPSPRTGLRGPSCP